MRTMRERLRMKTGAFMVDNLFRVFSRVGKMHPHAKPARHNVEVIRDIDYRGTGRWEHRLDVYRPKNARHPLPVVLYVHGGGFRILSKDTHWVMGLAYARRGYLVFNISYRLAPQHPYPAALEDATAAYHWVLAHAEKYGGDLSRLVLAGESAGGNLITGLTIAACYHRPEPWARSIFATGVVPRAVVPFCPALQVSDSDRFFRRKKKLPAFLRDRLIEISEAYLEGADASRPGGLELADPLLVIERGEKPARPLPPFCLSVGTKDPVLDDTRRMKAALDKLGVTCDVKYYEGELHAFQAMVFLPNARRCWLHTYKFLDTHLS
jgi:acetyl esterase